MPWYTRTIYKCIFSRFIAIVKSYGKLTDTSLETFIVVLWLNPSIFNTCWSTGYGEGWACGIFSWSGKLITCFRIKILSNCLGRFCVSFDGPFDYQFRLILLSWLAESFVTFMCFDDDDIRRHCPVSSVLLTIDHTAKHVHCKCTAQVTSSSFELLLKAV